MLRCKWCGGGEISWNQKERCVIEAESAVGERSHGSAGGGARELESWLVVEGGVVVGSQGKGKQNRERQGKR